MKTNFNYLQKSLFRQIILVGTVCIIAIFAGYVIATRGLEDKVWGDKVNAALLNHSNWSEILILFFRRILILLVIGASVFLGIWSVIKKNYEYLLFGSILSFAFASTINAMFFSLKYVDSSGLSNSIGLTNSLLVFCFFILIIKEPNWFRQIFSKPILWCFIVLGIIGFLTQGIHLGFGNGSIVIFIRIVQPLIFIILISHIARSKQGVKKIIVVLITSISLIILFRIISPSPVVTNPLLFRATGFGSWTLYGTLLVASIPFAIVLWVTTPRLRIFISGIVPLTLYEAYLTQTRGAIVALGALGLFVVEKRFRVFIIPIILAFVWLLSRPDTLILQFTGGRSLSFNPQVMASDTNWLVRVERNLSAIRYIQDHPFTGLGLGQPTLETGPELAFWVYNPYLHWGVAMGIPAMLSFVLIMFLSALNAIRNFLFETRDQIIYQLGILSALVVWVINQFTTADSMTYMSSPEPTLMFYFVIGLILGQQIERESKYPLVRENHNRI